jgi:hypothetical protein
MNEGLDALPDDVRALLRAEKARLDVPDDARARLAGRLASTVPGFGQAHVPAPSAGPASGATAVAALKGTALLLALGVAGAVSVGAIAPSARPGLDGRRVHATTGRVLEAHAPRVTVEKPDVMRSSIAPNASPPVLAPPAPPPPAPPIAALESLREERRLLDASRDAIARGEPERALGLTARYAALFPRGVLAEERDALRIRALAHLGREEEARALLDQMRAAHPQSFLLEGATSDVEAIP